MIITQQLYYYGLKILIKSYNIKTFNSTQYHILQSTSIKQYAFFQYWTKELFLLCTIIV